MAVSSSPRARPWPPREGSDARLFPLTNVPRGPLDPGKKISHRPNRWRGTRLFTGPTLMGSGQHKQGQPGGIVDPDEKRMARVKRFFCKRKEGMRRPQIFTGLPEKCSDKIGNANGRMFHAEPNHPTAPASCWRWTGQGGSVRNADTHDTRMKRPQAARVANNQKGRRKWATGPMRGRYPPPV